MSLRVEGIRSINWNASDPKAAERFGAGSAGPAEPGYPTV